MVVAEAEASASSDTEEDSMCYVARHCKSLPRGAVGDAVQLVPAPATISAPALAPNEVLDTLCL